MVIAASGASSAVFSYPFCPSCGTKLGITVSSLLCPCCDYTSLLSSTEALPTMTTYSGTRPIPTWAKSEEDQRIGAENDETGGVSRATVTETCPQCQVHEEVSFYTLQLRSVDEGQTVFMECQQDGCKHTWSVNN
jgi:DNA-directed RNA polymerase I subunit RPA12